VPAGRYVVDARPVVSEVLYLPPPTFGSVDRLPVFSALAAGFEMRSLTGDFPQLTYREGISRGHTRLWGKAIVEVSDSDVRNVEITLAPTLSISGRVEWSTRPGADKPAPLSVIGDPATGSGALGMPMGQTEGEDPTRFRLDGFLPGRYFLRVSGVTVTEIVWQGRDYSELPFDMSEGVDIRDVVLRVGDRNPRVTGTVRRLGLTVAGAVVLAFPIEPEQWRDFGLLPPRLTSAVVDTSGRYSIVVPSGRYYLVALPFERAVEWKSAEFLRRAVAGAVSVVVANDVVRDLAMSDLP
jgi:hypothetical protein